VGKYPYLNISCASVQVQVNVLDLAIFSEFVLDIFLGGLLMNTCNQQDPTLDS